MNNKTTLYGISSCDTIRKAKRWLDDHSIDFDFHDYRKQGIDHDLIKPFLNDLGWEALLNRRGTTWRQVPEETRNNINLDTAVALMLEQPAIIKRPVLSHGKQSYLGFSADQYSEIFQS